MLLFRDDMLDVRRVLASQYYTPAKGYESFSQSNDYEMDQVEYRAPGRTIAERLDLMGVTAEAALSFLDKNFNRNLGERSPSAQLDDDQRAILDTAHEENMRIILADMTEEQLADYESAKELRESLDSHRWMELLASASEDGSFNLHPKLGSREWLLAELESDDHWDERYVLRAVLLAIPEAEVTLDVTDLNLSGYVRDYRLQTMASTVAAAIQTTAGRNGPVIVLTEGRTDAEFITAALGVLYPHLTDLIRVLDYDYRPEGGVGALVRMVRAFAAAGIVNRVVAIFDNDTAASDGLRTLDIERLPDHIRVLRYPPIELASNYPTLGPPTVEYPHGTILPADVNGSAGSIELYLGQDVLAREDGTLRPVQWKSFIVPMARYQGEVTQKEVIHAAFRAKYAAALAHRPVTQTQDWEGLRMVIDAIRASAQSAL